MSLAMFTLEDDVLTPSDVARSMWSHDQMHGVAVSGALARGLEQRIADLGRTDLQPARYTVDLFKQARMAPCTVTTEVVREGRRSWPVNLENVEFDEKGGRHTRDDPPPTEHEHDEHRHS